MYGEIKEVEGQMTRRTGCEKIDDTNIINILTTMEYSIMKLQITNALKQPVHVF